MATDILESNLSLDCRRKSSNERT